VDDHVHLHRNVIAHGDCKNIAEHDDDTRIAQHGHQLRQNAVGIRPLEAPDIMRRVPPGDEVLEAAEIAGIDEAGNSVSS
jgi:hypothetical protein